MSSTADKKYTLITGGLGFIGSAYLWYLNQQGNENIILVDHFRKNDKWLNVRSLRFYDMVHPNDIVAYLLGGNQEESAKWSEPMAEKISTIIHLGACSATTETDMDFLFKNNFEFSKTLWNIASEYKISFLYASSAATYGNGTAVADFSTQKPLREFRPLNKYGYSKQLFDLWVERQIAEGNAPPQYAGLKFFNVFGPNEYHKGSMASVVFHAYHQIKSSGKVKLFKSYHPNFPDGGQQRDFVYIKDITVIMGNLHQDALVGKLPETNFLYNLGSGIAHTFVELVTPIFSALGLKEQIEFIDMPESLKSNYQYFTQAEMNIVCDQLAPAVGDYVTNHLNTKDPYLSDLSNLHYSKS